MRRCWLRWFLVGMGFVLAPMAVEGQERPRPPQATKATGSPQSLDGNAAADPRMRAEAHYELGVLYHERVFESLDRAIVEYEQAVKLRADYAEAHYYLGLAYHTKAKLGNDEAALYKKALAAYQRYLKLSPKGELAGRATQNIKVVEARLRR